VSSYFLLCKFGDGRLCFWRARESSAVFLHFGEIAMSTNRFAPRFAPLRFDPSRAFVPFTAISRTELIALNERLETARRELLSDLELDGGGEDAFVDLPDQLLADYQQSRGRSGLGQILAAGKRLRDAVDRVVVLDGGGSLLGARALFDACCHPYHNELSRGDRGGRPRIYFVDDSTDNDSTQGLLDLLGHDRRAANLHERWAIMVVDDGSDEPEISPMLCCLLAALSDSCGGDHDAMAKLFVPIGGAGGGFSVLSAGGLLPAAVMGLDIVRLLQGAAMMNERFRTAPPGDNPVLDFAGVSHVMEKIYGANSGGVVPWASALESTVRWCDGLQWAQHDRQLDSATSGGLSINLVSDSVRRDRLVVPLSEADGAASDDEPDELSGKSFPDLQAAILQSAREAYAVGRRPTADLHLPALDESALGQFFQMMMLAAAIEGRLHGGIPYGETPTETYKSRSD
jgi:glucose-6-phosphate isomerase